MIAGAVQRVLIISLAGLLVLAPALSGGQHWSLCVDHEHGSQCAMLCFSGLAAAAPVVVPPARRPEFHDVVEFAIARVEIVPAARGPPYA